MRQWTNSNIRRKVTDGPFLRANKSKFTFDPKKKNPYWLVMVANIINSIVESRMRYRDDDFFVPVLFNADGLLLARSCGEAEDMIQRVTEVAGECGLNINKGKSNVLLFNHDGIILEEVGGIRVSNTKKKEMDINKMAFSPLQPLNGQRV